MQTIRLLFISVFLAFTVILTAQDFTQSIKGQVIDKLSQTPLPGANVIVPGTNPLIGTATDMNGYFKLDGIPVGRVNLEVHFMGYVTVSLNSLNLNTGKELILAIEMEEEIYTADEVVIRASQDKSKPINEMATVSAREFTIEESERFAGARNDVARMASNFAGVSSHNDAVNDIVIRGNSPNGLLWRLEGIDIPNPNHFGQMGATGGPVSMLNNNVLANSDFMTSAFPAGYGNALSGVFDLNMRTGNYDKFEFLAQVGFNGFELGIEGPISRETNASFVANYRYSTLGLMSTLGINFGTGSAIPYYQDLSFNVDLPTRKAGKFSIFGLAGKSHISFVRSTLDSTEMNDGLYNGDDRDIYTRGKLAVMGLTHTYLINNSTYTKIIIAGTYNQHVSDVDSIVLETRQTVPYRRWNLEEHNLLASLYLNKKFSPKNNVRVGGVVNRIGYNLSDSVYTADLGGFRTVKDENGATWFLEAYISWQHKFSDMLILNTGLHYQYLTLNGSQSLEPRLGLSWIFHPKHTISFGYGMHSRTQIPQVYFTQFRKEDGTYYKPNENLDFTRAHHFVVGYDWNITQTLRLKAETYYQYLYDAPVERVESSFSMLNFSSMTWGVPDSLISNGPGRNYGIELTFEKFLDHGLYFLLTTSLFDSKYKGSDGVLRSTAFDSKYIVNMLAGKEFEIKSAKDANKLRRWIVLDGKMTVAGGQLYTPVDVGKSQEQNQTVYQDDKAFTGKFDDYFRLDIRVAFRMDFKKTSHEISFDVQNVTNRQNPLFMKYNRNTGQEEVVYQIGIFPIAQYKVVF